MLKSGPHHSTASRENWWATTFEVDRAGIARQDLDLGFL